MAYTDGDGLEYFTGSNIPQDNDPIANGAGAIRDIISFLKDTSAGLSSYALPVATIVPFGGGSTLPSGWLPCDGSTIGNSTSGADYANDSFEALFDLLKSITPNTGGSFADGDTVKLPDLSRRVLVGTGGTSTDTLGNTAGATGGAEEIEETYSLPYTGWGSYQAASALPEPTTAGRLITGSGGSEIAEALESLAHANANPEITINISTIQPSYVANFLIKY